MNGDTMNKPLVKVTVEKVGDGPNANDCYLFVTDKVEEAMETLWDVSRYDTDYSVDVEGDKIDVMMVLPDWEQLGYDHAFLDDEWGFSEKDYITMLGLCETFDDYSCGFAITKWTNKFLRNSELFMVKVHDYVADECEREPHNETSKRQEEWFNGYCRGIKDWIAKNKPDTEIEME